MSTISKIYVCMYFLFRYESHCKGSNDSGETWKGKNYMHILIKLWLNNLSDLKEAVNRGWWVAFICNGLFEDDNILSRKRRVVEIEFLGFKRKISGVRN